MKGNKKYLGKIKAKQNLIEIFSYIKNINFKFELFKYSKLFQNKLGINYIENSVAKYLDNSNFIDELFGLKEPPITRKHFYYIESKTIAPNIKKSEMTINKELQKKYLINYLRNLKQDKELYIEINSQFFDFILEKGFIDNFSIKFPICDDDIINCKDIYDGNDNSSYKNYYNLLYEKLNKYNLNKNALSFYFQYQYQHRNALNSNFVKEIKINFNRIKKLSFLFSCASYETIHMIDTKKIINLYKEILTIKSLQNNLVYLDLHNILDAKHNLQNLNKFKSLLNLELKGFEFDSTFILELKTLKKLTLECCKNIGLSAITCLNLKELTLINYEINNSNSLLKFPELEKMRLCDNILYGINLIYEYIESFDFNSFKKLKEIKISDSGNDKSFYINMIKNICAVKSLKNIEFTINNEIKEEDILKINEENNSVENIIIYVYFEYTEDKESKIYNLLKKFPNTKSVSLFIPHKEWSREVFGNSTFEIKESQNLLIDKLYINISSEFFKFKLYCHSFEKLKEIAFHLNYVNNDLEKSFPIFNKYIYNKNNNIIFKSLTTFEFIFYNYCEEETYDKEYYLECKKIADIIENIYNNICQIYKI